jgi:histidinol-phosphatase (PHP family)
VTIHRKESPIFTSYHVHSRWSDGSETIAEMVAAAARHQFIEMGISDHLVVPPDEAPISWSIPPSAVREYVAEILDVRSRSTIPVRVGVEVDYFPGQMPVIRELLSDLPIDYLIGSVHFVDGFPVDESASFWEALDPGEVDEVWRGYWHLIEQMAGTGFFQLAAHLDLPKKFGFRPSRNLDSEIGPALDAIARAGMTVEMNTSGWDKPCQEAYPSEAILSQVTARGIPILISADAHRSADLANHFGQAADLLKRLRVSPVVRLNPVNPA